MENDRAADAANWYRVILGKYPKHVFSYNQEWISVVTLRCVFYELDVTGVILDGLPCTFDRRYVILKCVLHILHFRSAISRRVFHVFDLRGVIALSFLLDVHQETLFNDVSNTVHYKVIVSYKMCVRGCSFTKWF
jgi:hypothetical protein